MTGSDTLAWTALALFALAGVARGDEVAAPERFDTVVVDAGHGGEDTGARGVGGLLEKDLVLDVAQRLARALRADGLHVIMTREDDVFVPLEARTAIANDARADLFLSVHANAAPDRDVSGTEIFFLSLEASDESARRVAERENAAFGAAGALAAVERDPLVAILGDLIVTEHMHESDEFAKLAQAELAALDARARGVKQAPFVVLHGVQMPSALVEIGFLTNRDEERMLRTAALRDRLAAGLARAVQAFGRRYDARRGVGERDSAPAAAGGGS